MARYRALLVAGITVVVDNWRGDPLQRTGYHVTVFTMHFVTVGLSSLGSPSTCWRCS